MKAEWKGSVGGRGDTWPSGVVETVSPGSAITLLTNLSLLERWSPFCSAYCTSRGGGWGDRCVCVCVWGGGGGGSVEGTSLPPHPMKPPRQDIPGGQVAAAGGSRRRERQPGASRTSSRGEWARGREECRLSGTQSRRESMEEELMGRGGGASCFTLKRTMSPLESC